MNAERILEYECEERSITHVNARERQCTEFISAAIDVGGVRLRREAQQTEPSSCGPASSAARSGVNYSFFFNLRFERGEGRLNDEIMKAG